MTAATTKIETFFAQFPAAGYPKAHLLVAAGSKNRFFYYVETGAVKMSLTSPTGRNLVVHIFFPGSFFSLLTLVSEGINEYDFITVVPTTVRKVPISELQLFLESHNDVLFDLQLRLLKGLQGLVKRLEQATLTPAHQQVANLIVYFATHFAENELSQKKDQRQLTIHITHQEIADWLGLTRENVSLHMKVLEEKGLISMQDHLIKVPQLAALKNVI